MIETQLKVDKIIDIQPSKEFALEEPHARVERVNWPGHLCFSPVFWTLHFHLVHLLLVGHHDGKAIVANPALGYMLSGDILDESHCLKILVCKHMVNNGFYKQNSRLKSNVPSYFPIP